MQCRKRAGREKGTAKRIPNGGRREEGGRQCRRRAGRRKTASGGRALRNAGEKAIKTEICLSAASLFPFSRIAGVSARSDAALIFLFANFFFSSRKRKSGCNLHQGKPPLGKKEYRKMKKENRNKELKNSIKEEVTSRKKPLQKK